MSPAKYLNICLVQTSMSLCSCKARCYKTLIGHIYSPWTQCYPSTFIPIEIFLSCQFCMLPFSVKIQCAFLKKGNIYVYEIQCTELWDSLYHNRVYETGCYILQMINIYSFYLNYCDHVRYFDVYHLPLSYNTMPYGVLWRCHVYVARGFY